MSHRFGEKVMLREYRENDYDSIRAWVNDPKIVETLSDIFLYPQSEKQTRTFMDLAMGPEWKGFIIAKRETEEYLGQIDFVRIDAKNGWGELGLVIGKSENHGQGYGSEALELMLEFAFNELRLNRVELVCWSFNEKGHRAYKKVGFVQEGVRRAKRYRKGQYHDEVCYGILKSEWQARKNPRV